ncbi:MAG: PEP-CTERM sorting domain-containing protein [Phycisphaeraceae bacterium]|nr:hypothetical protein [Phycisphaerales bacterium]MCA9307300.1 hypothetical protein [Phycisphaerales bacterium]MCB9842874.1 PEP-CTERM sorting domain-containing protein [Phycisphaeraceae bacterium]
MTHLGTRLMGGAAALLACAAAVCAGGTTTVTFDGGAAGWSGPSGIGGATTIPATGGNPGANMRTVFNDFGITFRNDTNAAFIQNLSQYDEVTISIDTLVEFMNFFGQDVSRPWLIELRDYDNVSTGYPWVSVWFKFADISQSSTGTWTTFSVTIDDPQATALPAGWGGYGDEDPMTFEPILPADRTFADVLAGVDEIVFTTLEPGFFFGFTDHTVRIDNISITTVTPPSCPGDVTGPGSVPDGVVDVDDLNAILSAWGTTVGGGSPLDLANGDGFIDVDDLNVVLSNWGCN